MPVNAGVEYIAAEQKYHNAGTKEEKLAALIEMLRTVPKHKGTENLRKEFTVKIAKLRQEIEKEKTIGTKKGAGGPTVNIKKEGAAQIAIIGLPNSGKSTLLNKLTGVETKVADYPFTTTVPVVGMMNYKGVPLQLVEMPALIEGSHEGKANGPQIISSIRNADSLVILCSTDEEKKIILKELEVSDIKINSEKPNIIIKTGEFKGLTFSGIHFLKVSQEQVVSTLKGFGIHNASVLFQEPTTIEKILEVLNERIVYKKAMFLNAFEDHPIEELKKMIFELSGKIIVFTKKPGQQPDLKDPLVLDKGSTVEDFAEKLHKDLAKNLKSVKIWGSSKFQGQHVAKNYKLENEDIIELSA